MTNTPSPQSLGSGQMFDAIASKYDRLNQFMSMGIDRLWRRRLVRLMGPFPKGGSLLDVATGTGDVALALAKAYPGSQVTGLDPSREMVKVGESKVVRKGYQAQVDMVIGDGQALPFADGTFAGSCIAFGIRNVPDRALCLAEMTRVTRPGGRVLVLELNEPVGGLLAPVSRAYVRHVLPRIGGWFSGTTEYRYLQESIAAFPSTEEFEGVLRSVGLVDVQSHRMVTGSAHLFAGTVS